MDTNTLQKPAINFKAMSWTDRLIVCCGVGFGSGLLPKAPGTFGSAFALLFIPIWFALGFIPSLLPLPSCPSLAYISVVRTAQVMGVHDDGRIVWDEFAGQSITFYP